MKSMLKTKCEKKHRAFAKATCAAMSALLIAGNLTGCFTGEENATTTIEPGADFNYPIETDETLQHWYVDYTAGKVKREEAPLYQEIARQTGVEVEYVPVSPSVAQEQFNLLLASGNIPDIVTYDWIGIPGGAQAAVDGGHILRLNDLIDDYMPNLKAYLEEDPSRDKQAKNDEGNYCFVPAFRGDPELLTYTGPIVRKDWLDDLGLVIPETIDQWYTMLKAFQEQKGADAPFVCSSEYLTMFISGAYPVSLGGYSDDCYLVDGKVVYGPIQPSFKEAVRVLSKWYEEGLIDPNIASVDSNAINSKMTNGQSGASIALAGGGMGTWLANMQGVDPNYNLVGTKYPVVNEGDTPYLGQLDNTMMNSCQGISANTKNPALVARYMDFYFSEEGIRLFCFGQEGVAYDLVDGNPVFKKEILEGGELDKYANVNGGTGVQQWEAYSQNLRFENQKEAIQNWGISDATEHLMPPVTFTTEESSRVTKILSDIKTYQSEMFFKFVFGVEDIETGFDAYVQQIEEMGIGQVLECKQAAYDRYNNR